MGQAACAADIVPYTEDTPHGLTELAGLFVERSPAGLYLIQDDLFRYVNPAFARMFGYAREELIDRRGPADVIRPEDQTRIGESRHRLLAAGDPSFHYEGRGVTKTGAVIDIEVMVTAAAYRGRPAILGTVLEVTGRKRAEREAAESREEVEALHRSSSGLLSADRVDGLTREMMAALQQEFGQALVTLYLLDDRGRRLEQVACSDADLGMPLAQPLSDPWIAATAAREGETVNVSDVAADPRLVGGALHLGSELAVPLRIGERVLGVLDLGSRQKGAFSGRDVLFLRAFADRAAAALDRARLLARLRDRTHLLERFHELALTMVGDPRTIYRAIAGQVAELLGVPYAGVVRIEGDLIRALAMMTPGGIFEGQAEPIEPTPCRVVQEARENRVFRDVATLFPRDTYLAREQIRTFIGVPILNRRGDVVGILDALDHRDRSFGPDEMRTLNLLARRAAEEMEEERRTKEKEATERRLLQSEKMASLGQLIAGVAHELNNPLASVLGLAELLLRREQLPEATTVSLRTIVAEAERARGVVRNLLAFAREREPETGPTSLEEVVSRTLALRENEMRVSGIETVRVFAGDLPVTLADAHLLQQVVLNLILNAEQAMLEANRHGRLTVRTRFLPGGGSVRPGPTLRLEIEDDGPGIPEADLGRIFEPFFTTKAVGKGTGLGLSLTHSIVEQHGGAIWAESGPGRGARFVIELPHLPPPADAAPAVAFPAATPPALYGRRILLADDEQALREIAREVLEDEGCVVTEADSGRAALARLEAEEFDLVVSDVKMPDLGGLEVYRRACAARPSLRRRFLFVTGDWVSEDTARFLSETGCAHLEKPYNVSQLVQKVEELIARA